MFIAHFSYSNSPHKIREWINWTWTYGSDKSFLFPIIYSENRKKKLWISICTNQSDDLPFVDMKINTTQSLDLSIKSL